MNREERRQLAMRVRRNIASDKEKAIFGALGKSSGGSNGWFKEVIRELRAWPTRPRAKAERNKLKAIRRARSRS